MSLKVSRIFRRKSKTAELAQQAKLPVDVSPPVRRARKSTSTLKTKVAVDSVDPKLKAKVWAKVHESNSRDGLRKSRVFLSRDDRFRVHMLKYCGYSAAEGP